MTFCIDCLVFEGKPQVDAPYMYCGHGLCEKHAKDLFEFIEYKLSCTKAAQDAVSIKYIANREKYNKERKRN